MRNNGQQAGFGNDINQPAGQPLPGHGVARLPLVQAPDLFLPPAKFDLGHGRLGAFRYDIGQFMA